MMKKISNSSACSSISLRFFSLLWLCFYSVFYFHYSSACSSISLRFFSLLWLCFCSVICFHYSSAISSISLRFFSLLWLTIYKKKRGFNVLQAALLNPRSFLCMAELLSKKRDITIPLTNPVHAFQLTDHLFHVYTRL